jgi:hypothetical protein
MTAQVKKSISRTKTVKTGLCDLPKLNSLCKKSLQKLSTLESNQDDIEWENFVDRKGEGQVVAALKECSVSKVWKNVCCDDGETPLEMRQGSDFVLAHFMPTTVEEIMYMGKKYPNLAFLVIVDEPCLASKKARELLATNADMENEFKVLMNEWYNDKSIDVSSQFTLDYINYSE